MTIAPGAGTNDSDPDRHIVAHHLRLFGIKSNIPILTHPDAAKANEARAAAERGETVVAIKPATSFCAAFGIEIVGKAEPPSIFGYRGSEARWSRLRSLHEASLYKSPDGGTIVENAQGATWVWLALGRGGILFVGTDLAGDIIRYRQGDPTLASDRSRAAQWGFEFERPAYLFEAQLAGEPPTERHADWWANALAEALRLRGDVERGPMLPGGAPGAVVITGDDDQAYLEKYAEQLALLGKTPITYFLHPQTRHTRKTLKSMLGRPWIDLGLHPDALDAPTHYGERISEQARWFRELVGMSPLSVRNHGFLNDGYWGHLPHWRREGVRISANLPGVDGRVINGSLLPARVVAGSELTEHWSILTVIGDGAIFASGMSDQEAAARITKLGRDIRDSGVPGIVVLNLHPQNVSETRAMHEAAVALVREGFHAWTMRECLAWFRDKMRTWNASDKLGIPDFVRQIRNAPVSRATWRHRLRQLIGYVV